MPSSSARSRLWLAGLPRVFDPKVDGRRSKWRWQRVVNDAGEAVRKLQNGAIPTYALSILLGVVAVLFYFLLVG
jgi:hypothetical protein